MAEQHPDFDHASFKSMFGYVVEFRSSLTKETDRGCALMVAAFLDSTIGLILRATFIDNEKLADEFLEFSGPMGSFSARIDAAHLMGLISPGVRRDLHLIRKIRNDFGHTHRTLTFEEPSVRQRAESLYHSPVKDGRTPRQQFVTAAMGVLSVLMSALYRAKHCESPKELFESDEEHHKAQLSALNGGRELAESGVDPNEFFSAAGAMIDRILASRAFENGARNDEVDTAGEARKPEEAFESGGDQVS